MAAGRGLGRSQTPGGAEGTLEGLWAPQVPGHARGGAFGRATRPYGHTTLNAPDLL